jgi:hypothetical protein
MVVYISVDIIFHLWAAIFFRYSPWVEDMLEILITGPLTPLPSLSTILFAVVFVARPAPFAALSSCHRLRVSPLCSSTFSSPSSPSRTLSIFSIPHLQIPTAVTVIGVGWTYRLRPFTPMAYRVYDGGEGEPVLEYDDSGYPAFADGGPEEGEGAEIAIEWRPGNDDFPCSLFSLCPSSTRNVISRPFSPPCFTPH